jgi:hypothetical protein
MKRARQFFPHRPDFLLEELVAELAAGVWIEFETLFPLVQANLRARVAESAEEEQLRRQAYARLQKLVQVGGAERKGQNYRGIPAGLTGIMERFAADHCHALLDAILKAVPHSLN